MVYVLVAALLTLGVGAASYLVQPERFVGSTWAPVVNLLGGCLIGMCLGLWWPVHLWHFEWIDQGPDGPITVTYP